MTVYGNNILGSDNLRCRFDMYVTVATASGTTALSCYSPPHVPGDVNVDISNNAAQFTSGGLVFRYDGMLLAIVMPAVVTDEIVLQLRCMSVAFCL